MQCWSKHAIRLFMSLAVVFAVATAAYGQPVIAIPRFRVSSANSSLAYLAESLADTLTTSLTVTKKVSLVERERLDTALSELKLALSGIVDESTSSKVGKQVGASNVLLGSLSDFGGVLRIDIRIIDVATGQVLGAVTDQCAGERELPKIIERLTPEIARIITGEAPPIIVPTKDSLLKTTLGFALVNGSSASTLPGYDNQRSDTTLVGGQLQAGLQLGIVGIEAEALITANSLQGIDALGSGASSTQSYMGRIVLGSLSYIDVAPLVGHTRNQEIATIKQGLIQQVYRSTTQGVIGGIQASLRLGNRSLLSTEVRYAPHLTREHTRQLDTEVDAQMWHVGPYVASSLTGSVNIAFQVTKNWHLGASYRQTTLTVPAQTTDMRWQHNNTTDTSRVLVVNGTQVTHQYALAITYRY